MFNRNPFELLIMVFSAVAGGFILFSRTTRPISIEQQLATPYQIAYGFLLLFGGVVGIIGFILYHYVVGLVVQQVGLSAVGSSMGVGCIAIVVEARGSGIILLAVYSAIGLSCLWRYIQIQGVLNELRHD